MAQREGQVDRDPTARLALLDEASTLLSATPDYQTTLRWVTHLVVPRLADWCVLDILQEDGSVRRLEVAHVDPTRRELAQALRRFPAGPANPLSPASIVMRSGRSELYTHATDELLRQVSRSPEHLELLREIAPCSAMVVPLRARGRILGSLSLLAAESGRHFEREDLLLTEELARRCALSVDNARILANERRERRASESLQAITAALLKALTPAEVAEVVIELGLPGIGAQAGAVALLDADRAALEMVVTVGYPPEMADALHVTPLGASTPMAEAARSGAPVWREATDDAASRFRDYSRANRGFPSGLALPLIADGRVLGALALSFSEPRTFDRRERAYTLAIAAQCALALERARLYDAERRARATAEASAAQLEIVLRGVADGIVAQDTSGRIIYANDAAARLVGYPSAEALIDAPTAEWFERFEVLDESGRSLPLKELPGQRALVDASGRTAPLRFRLRATGEERWALISATPVTDVTGQVTMAISIFRDITEQQLAQQRLAFLAEASTILGSSLDYDLTLTRVADLAVPALADACVIDVIEPVGGRVRRLRMRFTHTVPPDLVRAFEAVGPPDLNGPGAAAHVLRTGKPIIQREVTDAALAASARDEHHLRLLRSGDLRSSLLLPLIARGTVLGALTLVTTGGSGRRYGDADVALAHELARRAAHAMDNARLYAAEREARTEAQAAVRARDEFLSIAAHELRTPVTGLKTAAQLLVRSGSQGSIDPERVVRYSHLIDEQTGRLTALIDDLLDVAKLQAGRMELRLEVLDLASLLSATVDYFRETAPDRYALALRVEGAPGPVLADRGRLEQVFANLLGNAIKYSPDGGRIEVVLQQAGHGVEVQVRDPGIGLPPDALESIFEPFGRAENAARRHIQGLGLGLHIAREIVRRHEGRIWATSPGEHQGTTLSVWLPTVPATE